MLLCQVRAVFGKDPRKYSIMTTKFLGDDEGNVRGLITVDVEVTPEGIKVTHLTSLCMIAFMRRHCSWNAEFLTEHY